MSKPAKKIIKEIKVDLSKCNGCRACEKACAIGENRGVKDSEWDIKNGGVDQPFLPVPGESTQYRDCG